MKKNHNNETVKPYYIGLNLGPKYVGFAVTDPEYHLSRINGKDAWGVRVFNEAEDAKARRLARESRRRRRKTQARLAQLRQMFANEINKLDPKFFQRMDESNLTPDEKTHGSRNSLFADPNFTDDDYRRRYPTIYHLRQELLTSTKPHDVRLVFLALNHILQARGHFLFDIGDDAAKFDSSLNMLLEAYLEQTGIQIEVKNVQELHDLLMNPKMGKKDKTKDVTTHLMYIAPEGMDDKAAKKAVGKLANLLVGGKVKMSDLFPIGESAYEESFSIYDNDEAWENVVEALGDQADVLLLAKQTADALKLEEITGESGNVSSYMIFRYNKHKADIRILKDYLDTVPGGKEIKTRIFKLRDGSPNYVAYSAYKKGNINGNCNHTSFCDWLKKQLPQMPENAAPEIQQMYADIENYNFAVKLRTSQNAIIPNSLQEKELVGILNNASNYLPFLKIKGEDGLTPAEKIQQLCTFRIPYYVGPTGNSPYGWATAEPGRITPWNFEQKVDLTATAASFIEKMTGRCAHTGEPVLPMASLVYQEFTVLNEINCIKVNGQPISPVCKEKLFNDLFVNTSRNVTKKAIHAWLVKQGVAAPDAVITGVADTLTTKLSTYHRLRPIIAKVGIGRAEEIVRRCIIYGEQKKILRQWLIQNMPELDSVDLDFVCKTKFKDKWGRLSALFLVGLCHIDYNTGEAYTVLERMHDTNETLSGILSEYYTFAEQARQHKEANFPTPDSPQKAVETLYVSPKLRRGIWQALRVIDELVDAQEGAPKKIFIEVDKGEPPMESSRKKLLESLYKSCTKNQMTRLCGGEKERVALLARLNAATDSTLKQERVYLYFLQFGRCMFTGEVIDYEKVADKIEYNLDHIYPKSRTGIDNSLDNRVLVVAERNLAKDNNYPIEEVIRTKMHSFWLELHNVKAISDRKLERLTRDTPLTDEELIGFIQKRAVDDSQSVKAVAELLRHIYPNTRIIYTRASNISDFRSEFDLPRCPGDVNDHSYAKDAYLSIVIGNYFFTRFDAEFFKNIRSKRYSLNPHALYGVDVPKAWNAGSEGTLCVVSSVLEKNSVLFTRQSECRDGNLSDLQPKKAGSGQLELKKGMDIQKYGGYNNLTGSYFALVEIPGKKSPERILKPVLLTYRAAYERDPAGYARENWHPEARIIIQKIPMDALMVVDGTRVHLSGRSGETIIFKNANQLLLDEGDALYLKRVCKVACRRDKNAPVTENDRITEEDNLRLYRVFQEKLETKTYGTLFGSLRGHLANNIDNFTDMELHVQCRILREILRAFTCNPEKPSLTELCGVGTAGIISRSSTVSKWQSAELIHQSVTGLYEKKQKMLA